MTAAHTTRTETGNLTSACICRGRRCLGARMVVVASDNRNVQEWIYHYLEPYEVKGYAFCQTMNERDFSDYAGKRDTVKAFIEDVFFGVETIGKLDHLRKQYPKLRIVVFSASNLPPNAAACYVHWSKGSYFSLRDSEEDIIEALEAVF